MHKPTHGVLYFPVEESLTHLLPPFTKETLEWKEGTSENEKRKKKKKGTTK